MLKKEKKNVRKIKEISNNHKIVCEKCTKEIKTNEKCILVRTYLDLKTQKEQSSHYYHFNCWLEYFNNCVVTKLQDSMSTAMKFMGQNPFIHNLLKNAELCKI